MPRTRVEDLGKISILIDEVLNNTFFDEEIFVVYAETDRSALLKALTEGVGEIRKKLWLIKEIANGNCD